MTRTLRPFSALLLATGLILVPAAGSAQSAGGPPVLLKDRVLVAGETVRLSDLFANLPEDKDAAVTDAPVPGDRLILGSRQLIHFAQTFGINWRPRHAKVMVQVERDSVPVPMEFVRETLHAALSAQYLHDAFDVQLYGNDSRLHVPTGQMPRLEIRALEYDPRSERFSATIGIAGSRATAAFAGKVEPMVEVPVLRNHAMPGDVIGPNDIAWLRVPARRTGPTTVASLDDLVGYTPRRPISAGRPLRLSDVMPDILVKRGDTVTIILKTAAMTLSARGEALEKGAAGDVIRVRNNQSRKVIEARVHSPDTVTVGRPPQLAALN